MIEIDRLEVRYPSGAAVKDLSVRVARGEIFGFLGPNGAGKSTTIKALLGLVPYQAGSIKISGLSPADPRSRVRVGYLPEEANYYRFLTPVELLLFYGALFGIPGAELRRRTDALLELVGLSSVKKRYIGTFSKGMTQKVSLAQALINEPDTLILDEPASGLDPLARMDLRRILTDLKARGKTIFFSSHELSEVELLCDSVAILKNGSVVRAGSLKEILAAGHEKQIERFFLETIRGEA